MSNLDFNAEIERVRDSLRDAGWACRQMGGGSTSPAYEYWFKDDERIRLTLESDTLTLDRRVAFAWWNDGDSHAVNVSKFTDLIASITEAQPND